jgi:hypothetical protein
MTKKSNLIDNNIYFFEGFKKIINLIKKDLQVILNISTID